MAEPAVSRTTSVFIGNLLNDLGAMYTPALYAFKDRELILDIFEAVSGSRMMCNYFRFGGVVRDVPAEGCRRSRTWSSTACRPRPTK